MAWMAWACLSVHPFQLSYANEAAGGPQGVYRLLGDSNVDWGQDLPALAEVVQDEKLGPIRLSYFGSDDPAAYGIEYEALPSIGLRPVPGDAWWFEPKYEESFDPIPGIYAISAKTQPLSTQRPGRAG